MNAAIHATVAAAPVFPPSFDNDPWLFGLALFGRGVILLLSLATIVKLISRNRVEKIGAEHPVFYHRLVVLCFCMSFAIGSGSDVLTFLFWGELSDPSFAVVMAFAKFLDAITVYPFIAALFVPYWMRWMRWSGLVPTQKGMVLNGQIQDLRVTWTTGAVPFRIVLLCAATSALVSAAKYAVWANHVAR